MIKTLDTKVADILANPSGSKAFIIADAKDADTVAAGLAFWFEWDWEAAGRSLERALSLNPGDVMSHGQHGWFCLNRRNFDEAIREMNKCLELDPLMPLSYAWSACAYWSAGRFDESLREFTRVLEIAPHLGLVDRR